VIASTSLFVHDYTASGGLASTTAMAHSTETAQFHGEAPAVAA
jgi:hypothetical protein